MFTPTDPASSIRWFSVSNTHNTAAPPFAVMQITGVDTDTGAVTVTRPTGDGKTGVVFNGPVEIPAGGRGNATADPPMLAAYDGGTGTPSVGDLWGTATSSWLLAAGNSGFVALGDVDSDNEIGLFRPSGAAETTTILAHVTGAATASGGVDFYPAAVYQLSDPVDGTSAYEDGETIWLRSATAQPLTTGGQGVYTALFLLASHTVSADTRPLYHTRDRQVMVDCDPDTGEPTFYS